MGQSIKNISIKLLLIFFLCIPLISYSQEYNSALRFIVMELYETHKLFQKNINFGLLSKETATEKWLNKIWELRSINDVYFEKRIKDLEENINNIYQLDTKYAKELKKQIDEIIFFQYNIKTKHSEIQNKLKERILTAEESQNLLINFANE